jgi:hypothetical protein
MISGRPLRRLIVVILERNYNGMDQVEATVVEQSRWAQKMLKCSGCRNVRID